MQRLPDRIVTERLVLRQWTVADVAALTTAVEQSREHLLPWMPWAAYEPLPATERARMIEQWRAEHERGLDAVYGVLLGDGPGNTGPEIIVGGCGLHRRRGPGVLEIGYWLHVDHTGRGYATELARALTDAAFEIDGIDRVEIHHDRANVRSAGVPRRLGFTLDAESADAATAPGEEGIDCCWSIERAEWHERQEGQEGHEGPTEGRPS